MDDRITPKTAIRGFLDVASISKSALTGRPRLRRSSIPSTSTSVAPVQLGKRKSQSFSEVTPRTLIQGVLATTEVAPDTARKRPRTTPKLTKKALTPGTVTRSARKIATRLDVLATPGGSNPTPRTLIQGLINTAPVETPWNAKQVVKRTSPRNKPDFPTVTETLQSQAPGPSLSPFIKDPNSAQRPGGKRLRTGLRRAINRETFAAGIAEKLSQEEVPKDNVPETLEEFPSFGDSPQAGNTILDSIQEDSPQAGNTILDSIQEEDDHEADMSISEEENEEDRDEQSAEEEIVEERDAMQRETEEPADPVFVPVSVGNNQSEDFEPITAGTDNQSETAFQRDLSNEEEADMAEQTTMVAEGLSADLSAGGDGGGELSTGDDDDEAIMPTQPAPSSAQQRRGTPLSVRRSTPLSARRKSIPLSVHGKGTPASGHRKGTPASVHRKGTPVSAQIIGTPVSVHRKGSPVSADIRGTPVSAHTEGTSHSTRSSERMDTVVAMEDADDEDDDVMLPTQQVPPSAQRGTPRSAFRKSRRMDTFADGTTMVQTTLDGYSPLVTPMIAADRRQKTPAIKKTPAPLRTSVSQVTVAQPKKKPPPRNQQQKQTPALNTLPASLTKSIFAHFSKAKVSKEALAAVIQGSNSFFKRISDDLVTYASHAHRHTIEPTDVELLMKRQKLITDKESLHSLIEKYLPMEYRQELIPVARAGNKVTPKLGTI